MYGYNNPYMQQYQQPQTTQQDERVWVSNQQAAESYLLAPSSFVRLWDSSCNKFYEKRSDINGRPLPMDVYEYSRIQPQTAPCENEMGKISIEDINARFEEINSRIDKLEKAKKVIKNAKQSNDDDTEI